VFEHDDSENPRNWPLWYRVWALFVLSLSTWIIVLYSTSYTAAIPGMAREFETTPTVVTLGLTTYLLGLATGSLVAAPLSEVYGRQSLYLTAMIVWSLLIIPCALARSIGEILALRFLGYEEGAVGGTRFPANRMVGLYLVPSLSRMRLGP
jgi:MFS family permease